MKPAIAFLFILFSTHLMANDYIIFSVDHNLPMGEPNEVIQKNFYVNIGSEQGVREGTILDVFRTISRLNPYDNKKRMNYRVKVGQLKVVHSNEGAAIAIAEKRFFVLDKPILDTRALMIGDKVAVNVD